jgi:signal transduction histidine kinase
MLDSSSITAALLAAGAVLIVGFGAYWANPRRPINQRFFTVSTHVNLWLVCVHFARTLEDGQFWFRAAASLGAFFPFHLWLLKEAIAAPEHSWKTTLARGLWWFVPAMPMAALSFTEFFVPSNSNEGRGGGYYIYVVSVVLLYASVFKSTLAAVRIRTGVHRLELQILLLGGCCAGVAVVMLMALGSILFKNAHVQPFVVLMMYGVIVLSITTHRIFDARHLLVVTAQKSLFICIIATGAFFVYRIFISLLPEFLAFVGTTALVALMATHLSRRINRVFQLYPAAADARSRALAIAMNEMRPEPLKEAFAGIIKGWSRSDLAYILVESGGLYSCKEWNLLAESRPAELMKDLRWATIERLNRERETPDRVALRRLMEEHSLGGMVLSRGPAFNILVAVGIRPSRRPFTYPEIQQLTELASIFQTALARSYLWGKAQRAEQLATVGMLGASVAHEIRNPLVTIKSFVHLLPQHYDDRTFRERFFRLISEEVGRIDRLTEQLLDLASPRHYNPAPTPLHQVIISSLDLVATKADERRVALHRELQATPDTVITDANAARQVLLNLCFNGIQAQEQCNGDRWVRVATRRVAKGIELCVADNGPGIPTESRVHLFQAFHSTKSSGFGLGLVICHEILSSLDATITLDPFESGEGARFRIVFPCPQPTS